MAYNKVIYNGNTLIDLTADTAAESDVAQGKTFHKADGSSATGTLVPGGGTKYGTTLDNFIGDVDSNGVLQPPSETTFTLTGVTKVGNYALYYKQAYNTNLTTADLSAISFVSGGYGCTYMFGFCTALTSANLSALTVVDGNNGCSNMYRGCTVLSIVDLSSLTTVSGGYGCGYMFYGCTALTTIALPSLTTIPSAYGCGYMFYNSGLQTIDLSGLSSISGDFACAYMFYGCKLQSVTFDNLTTLTAKSGCTYMFQNCKQLRTLSFPSLNSGSFGVQTTQFNNMLSGVTGCTVHFPSNLQSVIGGWASVTAGFGGTNTTVLFDLPATT